MNRSEVKEQAKFEVISALMDLQEFGIEKIEASNVTEDEQGNLTEKWTAEEVEEIAREAAQQAERAIALMERKRKR